jgi:hypothetical protein
VRNDENDPRGPVRVSLKAVKTLGPDSPRRNPGIPRQSFLPVRLLLQRKCHNGESIYRAASSPAAGVSSHDERKWIPVPLPFMDLA